MNRKIEVGGVLSEVFSIYREQAGVLLPIAFWLFLVVAIVNGLASSSIGLLLLASIVAIIAGVLYQGVVVNLVNDVQDGRLDASAGDLVRQAMPFVAPLLGAGILAGLGIAVGLVLVIVPGLILMTIWAVVGPVIVIEKAPVMASFGRSRHLVKGNGWPVFGAIVVAYLIVVIGGIVLGAIGAAIADGPLIRIVFSAIASTITAPISALVAAVLYFRLRALEGVLAAPTDQPPPTVPPAPPAPPVT